MDLFYNVTIPSEALYRKELHPSLLEGAKLFGKVFGESQIFAKGKLRSSDFANSASGM